MPHLSVTLQMIKLEVIWYIIATLTQSLISQHALLFMCMSYTDMTQLLKHDERGNHIMRGYA